MKQRIFKIAPGTVEDVGLVGNFVRIKSASVPIRVQQPDQGADSTLEEGDGLNLKPFVRLLLSHDSVADQTIIVAIGNETSDVTARIGGVVQLAGTLSLSQASAVVGADAQLRPELAARRFLQLQNVGAGDVYYTVDGGAADATGFKLAPGGQQQYDTICPPGEIRAYSPTGSTVAYAEA